ncbi:MAG: O-antigen ligase family protein, partial [Colwellia sp.]|nr:O-antigen ligase family protein [Colwellia sp.]
FAFSLLFSASICIQTIFKQKNIYRKGVFCFILGVILYCIILTSSRGALLSVGVIFCMYIVFSKQKITYISILIIVCIALASILPAVFIDRWAGTIESGSSAGRVDIWGVGLMCLKKHWLIGAGLGNFPNAYSEFAIYAKDFRGTARAPHNIYLGTFVELGVVGFSFFVLAIIKHYQALRSHFSSNNSDQIMLKAAFFGLLIASFFLDTVYQKAFWLVWMMIMMHRNIPEYKPEE